MFEPQLSNITARQRISCEACGADLGYPKDPSIQLKSPDPVTIADLTPEQRQHIEIVMSAGGYVWRWKPGYKP